ncbi:MAG: hypothetical protein Q8P81_02765 [Nanoarchaeota archaeon]|nr:hypothetical protein [Nanoarchaeota archaeon]
MTGNILMDAGRILYSEDLNGPNAFFVRRRWGGRHPIDIITLEGSGSYGLYVPERFLLGDFWKSKGEFVLSEDYSEEHPRRSPMYLLDSTFDLGNIEGDISKGRLVKKVPLLLPERIIDRIEQTYSDRRRATEVFLAEVRVARGCGYEKRQ